MLSRNWTAFSYQETIMEYNYELLCIWCIDTVIQYLSNQLGRGDKSSYNEPVFRNEQQFSVLKIFYSGIYLQLNILYIWYNKLKFL